MKRLSHKEASILMSEAAAHGVTWMSTTACPGALITNEDNFSETTRGREVSDAFWRAKITLRSEYLIKNAKQMLVYIDEIDSLITSRSLDGIEEE